MDKFTLSICFIFMPFSFISRSIRPNLYPIPFSKISFPASFIYNTIIKTNRWFFYYLFLISASTILRCRYGIKIRFIFFCHTWTTNIIIYFTIQLQFSVLIVLYLMVYYCLAFILVQFAQYVSRYYIRYPQNLLL